MKQPILKLVFFGIVLPGLVSCNQSAKKDSTGEKHIDNEWISLFNVTDLSGWRSFHSDTIYGWAVEDSCLVALGEGSDLSGDIISAEQYGDFELYFEWKISPGGNSGVMFHVLEGDHKTTYETGPEYQLLDDEGYPDPLEDWQLAGANYAMHIAENKILKPAGEFNTSMIIVDSSHVEHWLNGIKILEYELWSEDWKKRVNEGKWKDYPDYGLAKVGHIALQDHGDKTWFRNIKIRKTRLSFH